MEDHFVPILAALGVVTVGAAAGIYLSLFKTDKGKKKRANSLDLYPAGNLCIYFGSQTGTAEGFARTLMEEGKSKGFNAKTIDLEEFDENNLTTDPSVSIFLMATYGEGEPTDNAGKFYRWVTNEEGQTMDNCLEDLQFSVFGLGNKQYEHYNAMGKATNKFLEKLGGKRVYDYGEGDDDGTLEEDFEKWKSNLWPTLIAKYHPDGKSVMAASENEEKKKVSLSFQTKVVGAGGAAKPVAIRTNQMKDSTKHFFTAVAGTVYCNKELRQGNSDEVGSTRHIEIDISSLNGSVQYETADNLAILPENNPEAVSQLGKILNYNLDEIVTVEPIESDDNNSSSWKYAFPVPCSVRDIFTKYFDIHGAPRHGTVAQLLPYVTDMAQQNWLRNLVKSENRSKFKSYVEEGCKSLFDVVTTELTSLQIPLSDLLHILTYLQPRYYTISSSSSLYPDTIHATVSVTEHRTASGKLFKGLCSNYLASLKPSSKVKIFVRPSTFKLPKSLSVPIVMIGPGTGFAPMRALLQEREFQSRTQPLSNGSGIAGSNVLYFGCKNKAVDYIYEDEIRDYSSRKIITSLHVAFSRDQANKVYVQNLLNEPENSQKFMEIIQAGGYVYVCGATSMGNDVHETIVQIIMKHNKYSSKQQAVDVVKSLQANGRYVQELWST